MSLSITINARPAFYLQIPLSYVEILCKHAELHYDHTCKSAAWKGGFLYGWKSWLTHCEGNYPATDKTQVSVTFSNLDLCLKIMEVTLPDETPREIVEMRELFRRALTESNRLVRGVEVVLEPRAETSPAPPRMPFRFQLSYEQFAMAYEAHMRLGGTGETHQHVDASWQAYQRDPAGHFITKRPLIKGPKYTVGQFVYVQVDDGHEVYEWSGKVLTVAQVGHEKLAYEYYIEGAPAKGSGEFPLLAWEFQLKPMYAPDGTMLNRDGNRSIFDDIDK